MPQQDKRELWGAEFAAHEDQHLNEVEQRWGDTEAYRQSANRVARYGRTEWEQINTANAAIEARIRDLMDADADPEGVDGMDVAEAQRLHISQWFYEMDHEFHVAKSDLYVHEEKFRAGIERNTRPGAAEWLQRAIRANAARHASGD